MKTPQEIANDADGAFGQYARKNNQQVNVQISLQYLQTIALANIAKNLETIAKGTLK